MIESLALTQRWGKEVSKEIVGGFGATTFRKGVT